MTPRIPIPRIFDGAWDSAIIATYGADLEFYERILLRQLSRTQRKVIFCDGQQAIRRLAEPDSQMRLHQLNRTYVLAPLRTSRAAHAKLIMLLSKDRGLLAVGSGNLGMPGYASQGECFATYRWSAADQGQLEEFLVVRGFIDQLCGQGLVDSVVEELVGRIWQDAPWLYQKSQDGRLRVRHNLKRALLDQFVDAIGGRSVNELIIHAPYYDRGCGALAELIRRTTPRTLRVLLQERRTSVDPVRLAAVLDGAPGGVDVRSVSAPDKGTFLHTKFLIARCEDMAICFQGSPNISSPALLAAYPGGNIELANLLVGGRRDFDHLLTSLDVSPDPADVSQLGLSIASEGVVEGESSPGCAVAEFCWVPPRLVGIFDREVRVPPQITVAGVPVAPVTWEIDEPSAGRTKFSVVLGEKDTERVDRVAAVFFTFEGGEESLTTFPYHLNTLKALASGQGRIDLLRQAGDFDLGDEELEELLAQLEEVLVVDGRSIWRLCKQQTPKISDETGSVSISYDDLDWDAIMSHPKLAQYRNWDQRSSSSMSALEILLTSIAKRFEGTAQRRHTSEPESYGRGSPSDLIDDLANLIEAEDEDAAEKYEGVRHGRRATARSRAKRRFHSFIQRFVNGLTDEAFVRHVGSSVIVPSYVIFNHLCWKLIQIDLADPLRLTDAQATIWRFFWGDTNESGYFATLSTGEQEAALDILERHHSEAVILCSVFQAFKHIEYGQDHKAMLKVRDAWRAILLHPLFQPTRTAVNDAAAHIRHECKTAPQLIKRLHSLAAYVADSEPSDVIGRVLGCQPGQVSKGSGQVNRGSLGPRVVPIYTIENLETVMTPGSASRSFSALSALDPNTEYIRLEDRSHNVVAFADYRRDEFLYANRATGDVHDLDQPAFSIPPWRAGLATLYELAG